MATSKPRKRLRRDPMSRVDTAWLRMERPTNPMMITGVLMFAQPASLERLKCVVDKRFLSYARFRQKPVEASTGTAWLQDEHFDLDWHVRESALPGPAGRRVDKRAAGHAAGKDDDVAATQAEKHALERFVSRLASSPLDPGRPLWQFDLVERRGGSALVVRSHHCYADGIALVQVLLSLTDTTPTPAKGSELSRA